MTTVKSPSVEKRSRPKIATRAGRTIRFDDDEDAAPEEVDEGSPATGWTIGPRPWPERERLGDLDQAQQRR